MIEKLREFISNKFHSEGLTEEVIHLSKILDVGIVEKQRELEQC